MNESEITSKWIKALRALLPGAVVYKHADRFTSGMPDFSVTYNWRTTWFEVKVLPNKITDIQWVELFELKRAFLIMWDKENRSAECYCPFYQLSLGRWNHDLKHDTCKGEHELLKWIVKKSNEEAV